MSDTLASLPEDVRAEIAPHVDDENEPNLLDAIGVEIAAKRDEARAARKSSGIEATWIEAEEAYVGIDDANRHEFADMRWAKPMSMDGPVTVGSGPRRDDQKSTAFVRLTSRYVDAGAAKLGEILLPADDKAFSFDAMPVPDLIAAREDESQVVHSDLGVPLTRPLAPGEAPPAGLPSPPSATVPMVGAGSPVATALLPGGQASPAQPPGAAGASPPRVPLTVKDLAVENIEMARKKAKAAETRIYDWMIQGAYRPEIRKVIADAARIGVGVLKAPTPKVKRVIALTKTKDGVELTIKQKIVPVVAWVDPWNIFPDPACGENIHDGGYVFERDYMSARQVNGLRKLPGYIAAKIDKVLEEGPNKSYQTSDRQSSQQRQKDRFEIWYFTGTLTSEEMGAINAASGKPSPPGKSQDQVHVIVTLVNDSVVRAIINPLDSGEFNYHSMPWQRRGGHWAGVGVAEQMRTPQRIVNASLRAMLNNAGKSADNQYVIDPTVLWPMDGTWDITPGKVWRAMQDAGGANMRDAFHAIQIPNTTDQMMKIVEFAERLAEETTSIPLISQGQSGATTPDTFGAAQLQNNNANQLLRSIGYAFDDNITEPVVRQFYEWLLLDPEVPNEEKGEYQIDAHGSSALVERAIQDQFIQQMGGLAANPIYGTDPKKYARVLYKSKRLNPDDLMYTEEEQAKIDAAPPPEAPQVTVAKINADANIKLGVMKQTADQQTVQAEGVIEQAANVLEGKKVETQQQQTQVDATIRLHELQMQHDRALMEYANKNQISLAAAKTELAKTAMTLQAQRELNAIDNSVDLHKHHNPKPQLARPPRGQRPPVQVPGRAGNGRGFEQAPAAQ